MGERVGWEEEQRFTLETNLLSSFLLGVIMEINGNHAHIQKSRMVVGRCREKDSAIKKAYKLCKRLLRDVLRF